MAIHNTASDAANIAVRAYLTSLGEKYLGHGFNTGSGRGRETWKEIQSSFNQCCAYCHASDKKLTIEHLISFNRQAGGLHHPGNIVPSCGPCNRRKKINGFEVDWQSHLDDVVANHQHSLDDLVRRRNRINEHITEYEYPQFSDTEKSAIQTIAQSLYTEITTGVKRSVELYWAIDSSITSRRQT